MRFFKSLLDQTGIYNNRNIKWQFKFPNQTKKYKQFGMKPLWDATKKKLKSAPNNMVKISEIYDTWRDPPYGVKDGLMPIFIVAFILAERNQISFYREGIFQVELKEIDVEFLGKNPGHTSIRLVESTKISRDLLSQLAKVPEDYSDNSKVHDITPINVARGLVSIYESLPQWTLRTNTLTDEVVKVRNLFKHAFDPNKFLFNDLMDLDVFKSIKETELAVKRMQCNIDELVNAYPRMLERIRSNLLQRLHVPDLTEIYFEQLRERAKNISQLSGDFRLEAFTARLVKYENTDEDIEGLASLAVNKLPKSWVDSDYDKANLEIANLARNFIQLETYAEVKGRANKRHAMAIVLGLNGKTSPIVHEFNIADADQERVTDLVTRLTSVLNKDKGSNNIVLAALAKMSAELIES